VFLSESSDEEEEETIFLAAKKCLSPTLESNLIGRELEMNSIQNFLSKKINQKQSGSLYVAGVPGTGKTATITHIVSNFNLMKQERNELMETVQCNCVSLTSLKLFYERIMICLNINVKSPVLSDMPEIINKKLKILSQNKVPVLFVFDEIDHLKPQIVNRIYEWPNIHSSVIVIGISNELSYIEKFPKIQSLKTSPLTVHFAAYSKTQISAILKEKLGHRLSLFQPEVIEFVSTKCSSNGDIRKAFEITIKIIDSVEKTFEGNTENKCIHMKHAAQVFHTTFGMDSNGIRILPIQQKLILISMVNLSNDNDLDLNKTSREYRNICTSISIDPFSNSQFLSACELLGTTEFISISQKSAKLSLSSKVEIRVSASLMAHAIKDDKILTKTLKK